MPAGAAGVAVETDGGGVGRGEDGGGEEGDDKKDSGNGKKKGGKGTWPGVCK